MNLIYQILIIYLVTAVSEYLTYKLIRRIDKKERIRLQKWENAYLEELRTKSVNNSNNNSNNN